MTNQEVLAVQKGLNAKGAKTAKLNREKGQNLTVDGIWGPANQAA